MDAPDASNPAAPPEIEVWRADLDAISPRAAELAEMLTSAERARAERLMDRVAASRFVAARALLRELLGRYLDLPPAAVDIIYEERGKPCVAPERGLEFNLTHAEGTAFLAISRSGSVGIDLERIRPLRHMERVARRVFAEDELESWLRLPAEERLVGFYRRWTRLEAEAKMRGGGVWALLSERQPGDEGVIFQPVPAAAGFVATLAHTGPPARLRVRDHPGT